MQSSKIALGRARWTLLSLALLYALGVAAGAISGQLGVYKPSHSAQEQSQDQNTQLESIFGRFRQPVRDGQIGAMLVVVLIVLGLNMLGVFISFTIPGVLVVPIVFRLLLCGWHQGAGLISLQASSALSLCWFLVLVGLESACYVVAGVAGTDIGMSLILPRTQGVGSRREAFKLAMGNAGRLYLLIGAVLTVQAMIEVLYVQKVLQMGGSGIPLKPY